MCCTDNGLDIGRSLREVVRWVLAAEETFMEGVDCKEEQVGRREWNARRALAVEMRDVDRQTDFCKESRERKRDGIAKSILLIQW